MFESLRVQQAMCPLCGAEATWAETGKHEVVEVECADCGRFKVLRTEFEKAQSDFAAERERERSL